MDHVGNRERLLHWLREELVGPAPYGEEIDFLGPVVFEDREAARGPWRQARCGEEVLQWEPPRSRYGVGVLHPLGDAQRDRVDASTGDGSQEQTDQSVGEEGDSELMPSRDPPLPLLGEQAVQELLRIKSRPEGEADEDTLDLTAANTYRPSTIGVSFLADVSGDCRLVVELPEVSQTIDCSGARESSVNGRYLRKKVQVSGRDTVWWLRQPAWLRAEFLGSDLRVNRDGKVLPHSVECRGLDGLDLHVEVFSRPRTDGESWLITVCLVNRTKSSGDECCLFQTHLRAWIEAPNLALRIKTYPAQQKADDPEEQSLSLLYRKAGTFAVGHGCSADWDAQPGATRTWQVTAECLPTYEAPSITPEVRRADNTVVEVPMAPLAGLDAAHDGLGAVEEVVDLYRAWIDRQESEVLPTLEAEYRKTARQHLDECRACLARMRDGLSYVRHDEIARRAFQLANHAILIQQARSRLRTRSISYDSNAKRIVFSASAAEPPLDGKWRPFQIAFLLMCLRSAADGRAPDREMTELIWFPTGGGKTEAYLGLAAYSIFARRLRARRLHGEDDAGTHVLMRYTLRLLTTQQFQRASALLCAMEHLRKANDAELGVNAFSIGIWVGGANTPNTRDDATGKLAELNREARKRWSSSPPENPFILTSCPWCGAQMGPVRFRGKIPDTVPRVYGYMPREGTVEFVCPDDRCEFGDGLPVYVIDDDIYDRRPSLVIGTVDKFAMLPWRPQARRLFGIDWDGEQETSPPGLVIQDELHLISGPLGSMVGLYETLVEELCTDRRDGATIRPKIIGSTATIRRFKEQIRSLYGRERVTLFPPPGLEASDSFFAAHARDSEGKLQPGRLYVGAHGTSTGSLQTDQVRAFTALLQGAALLPKEERDPWWTLLIFFNSLRVLGSAVSLFQADIPEHLMGLQKRMGLDWGRLRRLENVQELTGRLRSTEVPMSLEQLSRCYGQSGGAVDACLASSIIEVGVDIDRLSLMSVVGQPKTTSQYIQVTGRVGRRWWESPGLVVTIYIVSQPRDRSLYEKFRSYHERLYAQVEPTSVTPFSPPALDRALHAVLSGYARQTGDAEIAGRPYPFPEALVERFRRVVLDRAARSVDEDDRPNTLPDVEDVLGARIRDWDRWEPTRWDKWTSGTDTALLRAAGDYASRAERLLSWPTPMSMRSVDSECHAEITQLYKLEDGGTDA